MVSAFGGGIAAVIGRDKQYVTILHRVKYLGQSSVQFGKGPAVSLNVVPVPVQHIKIHKVYKQDSGKVFFIQAMVWSTPSMLSPVWAEWVIPFY